MLAVIENEQELAIGNRFDERVGRCRVLGDTQRETTRDVLRYERRIAARRELDPRDAVGIAPVDAQRQFGRKTRFAAAADTCDGDEALRIDECSEVVDGTL